MIRKISVTLVVVFVLGLIASTVSAASCKIEVSHILDNKFKVTVSGFPEDGLKEITIPNAGGMIQVYNGWSNPVDFDYNVPNRAYQRVTGYFNGQECGHADVNIAVWNDGTPPPSWWSGSSNGSSGSHSDEQVSSPNPACWNLLSFEVVKINKNTFTLSGTVMGELPDYPFTVKFGDNQQVELERDGGVLLETSHSYDANVLKAGVTVTISPYGSDTVCESYKLS